MDPPPSIARALDKVDELVVRLQQLQSTIADTRYAVLCSASPGGIPALQLEEYTTRYDQVEGHSRAEWRQWSAPAQVVEQELSEIVAVAKRTKAVSGGGLSASRLAGKGKQQVSLVTPAEDVREVNVNVEPRSQLLDELEQSRFVTKPHVPAQSMRVAKVKQSQKAWTLKPSKSKGAVMFPNVAYSPSSPPASAKNFRILNPFNNASTKRNIGAALADKLDKSQKLPLLGVRKRPDSPVKSLPALIDRLPSRTKPAVSRTPTVPAASSKSKELPYPPSYYTVAKDGKVVKKTGASSASQATPQPFKVLESNTVASRYMTTKHKGGEQHVKPSSEASARAKSISPRRKRAADKENLLRAESGKLMRSWSAGSSAFAARNSSGHSMIQRAKVWVLGKQFTKSSRA